MASLPSLRAPAFFRGFIALELSSALRGQLAAVIGRLTRTTPLRSVNWDRPDKIHLTLKFLGSIPTGDLSRLQDALTTAARACAPFSFAVTELGCFPNFKRPRVVWAGVAASDALRVIELQKSVEAELAQLSYPRDDRRFSPHVTLGRVRREVRPAEAAQVGQAVRAEAAAHFGNQAVNQIVLVKSDLQRGGSIYTRLFAADLRDQ